MSALELSMSVFGSVIRMYGLSAFRQAGRKYGEG